MIDFRNSIVYRFFKRTHGKIDHPYKDGRSYEEYQKILSIPEHHDEQSRRVVYILDRGDKGSFFHTEFIPKSENISHPQSFDRLISDFQEHLKIIPEDSDEGVVGALVRAFRKVIAVKASDVFKLYEENEITSEEKSSDLTLFHWACILTLFGDVHDIAFCSSISSEEEVVENKHTSFVHLVHLKLDE